MVRGCRPQRACDMLGAHSSHPIGRNANHPFTAARCSGSCASSPRIGGRRGDRKHLDPPRRHRSFHQLKDDGGGVNSISVDVDHQKNIGSRTSPPARRCIVPSAGGRWGSVNAISLDVDHHKKNSGSRTSTPRAPGRIVPSVKGRWGWLMAKTSSRKKLSLPGPLPKQLEALFFPQQPAAAK